MKKRRPLVDIGLTLAEAMRLSAQGKLRLDLRSHEFGGAVMIPPRPFVKARYR